MASQNSSLHRQLPATPGAPAAPSSPTSARPTSSSSTAHSSARGGSKESNRLSMQPTRRSSNVPRPAPIPIPEPIVMDRQPQASRPSHSSGSGEGTGSTDSASQELEAARAAMAALGNANANANANANGEGSPSTSPRETSMLLLANGELTPRSPPTPPNHRPIPRPRSAVETGAAMHDSASRPQSSADAWSAQRPSSANMDGNGQNGGLPGANSRSHSPSADSLLRPTGTGHGPMPRSRSSGFISSPLNPGAAPIPRRPGSSASRPPSMVLYRLAGIGDDLNPQMSSLAPPVTVGSRRASRFSTMSSTTSIVSDSKYPLPVGEDGAFTPPPSGAFLAYEYDPTMDLDAPDDAEDVLHAPDPPGTKEKRGAFGLRGVVNVCVIFTILSSLIVLFAVYPIISYYDDSARAGLFTGSTDTTNTNDGNTGTTRTNKDLVDPDTPEEAKSWSAPDGTAYKLVFSDEFKTDGRSFKENKDPFWTAVDLHDAKNQDLNVYDSGHVTTKGGHLVINLEQKQSGDFNYVSGMLQSWNQFCFTGGYVEISVSLPGTSQNLGYMPQAYTMGNLARAGYQATEEGVFPYSYDSCDTGASANQGDNGLSTLPGQRLSACTCDSERQNGQHPGPAVTTGNNAVRGRGAPQIDILGGLTQNAGFVSQSMRIAPFSEGEQTTAGVTYAGAQQNTFIGVSTEQVVSGLATPPTGSYVENGAGFTKFGYQHTPNTQAPNSASISWSMDSQETFAVQGNAFPAVGNQLGRRLISNEPMYIVLSLALSNLVQTVDTSQVTLPAKFLVDYVRVYQPANAAAKVTCDPSDYPTAKYISDHSAAYNDATKTTWLEAGYNTPINSLTGTC